MGASGKDHWEHVYRASGPEAKSWYQPVPEKSMAMIRRSGVPKGAPVIDVGGGASTLVDRLVGADYSDVTVLDISAAALDAARKRIGEQGDDVHWIETDLLAFEPDRRYYLWHDRAVFHFLVEPGDVDRYLGVLRTALVPKGHFVLATFGPEGPERCSNLPVHRYSLDELVFLLESGFDLVKYELEDHVTPKGVQQQFLYTLWRAKDSW